MVSGPRAPGFLAGDAAVDGIEHGQSGLLNRRDGLRARHFGVSLRSGSGPLDL